MITEQILNMNLGTKGSGGTIFKMVLEFVSMRKEICTSELGREVKDLAKALCSLEKAIGTLEIGSMTK